jgi:hypothetical protein
MRPHAEGRVILDAEAIGRRRLFCRQRLDRANGPPAVYQRHRLAPFERASDPPRAPAKIDEVDRH